MTGGASGIGAALALELVRSGAHVTIADRDEAALADTAARIGATPAVLDVRDAGALDDLVARVVAEHGAIDLMVNNAGITMGGPTHELSVAHWDRTIDINLRGVVHGVQAAYPRMVQQGHGQIVNTASAAGLVAPPFVVPYATTKHAVVGLSLGLRPEAALHGVRVNALCPGSVETPILDRAPEADLPPRASATVTARTYLAKLRQKPIPADRFAAGAMRGIERDQPIIVVPRSAKALWYGQRLSPGLVQRVLKPIAATVDHDLIHPAPPPVDG